MFEQVLPVMDQLPGNQRAAFIGRLNHTRAIAQNFGYGVGDDMDSLLARYIKP